MDPPSCWNGPSPKRTKAIIPVHLFGQCADMGAINEIARRHKIGVIEMPAKRSAPRKTDGERRVGRSGLFQRFFPRRIWAGSAMLEW